MSYISLVKGKNIDLSTVEKEDGQLIVSADDNQNGSVYIDMLNGDDQTVKRVGLNIIKEITQAEYDALPDSKYTDNITYFIKDATDGGTLSYEDAMTILNGEV